MSNGETVVINGQKYITETENGSITKLSRFSEEYGFWIELRFTEVESNVAEDLLKILSAEYVRQTTSKEQLISSSDNGNTTLVV